MNDPNGLIFHKGRYHLFFQSNPTGRTWGNIGWGHATSKDLVTWEELPLAIPATETEMAFSGSAVWDRGNSSGLAAGAEGPLVALFTSAYSQQDPVRPGKQAQSVAFSVDGGGTWIRYDGNPVIDRASENFRDPKVFWHEATSSWVMVVVEAAARELLIFTSANLLEWTHRSTFGPDGDEGILWECPDLIEVPIEGSERTKWLLILSTNPGGFSGGSGMRFYTGAFDGSTFVPDGPAQCLDHGPDLYAAVSFCGTDEPLIVGWMSNWLYANDTPTQPWQSSMTLARRLTLVESGDTVVIRQSPVGLDRLPDDVNVGRFTLLPSDDLAVVSGAAGLESRLLIQRASDGALVLDRSGADPHGVHAALAATPSIQLPEGPAEVLIIEDHGLVELFVNGGLTTVTMQTFPHAGPVRFELTPAR